jgi:hypothetical protein
LAADLRVTRARGATARLGRAAMAFIVACVCANGAASWAGRTLPLS